MDKIIKIPTQAELIVKVNEIIDNSHALQRNTSYAVGDIAYSSALPSWARLECVQAGITANVEFQWTNVLGGG